MTDTTDLPPHRRHDRSLRHLRARRPRHGSRRARLLRRRHGPPAPRHQPRGSAVAAGRSSWPGGHSASSPTPKGPRAGPETVAPRTGAGTDVVASTTAGVGASGPSAPRRAATGYPADSARTFFEHAAQQRSRWPRAMAFAALGAAAVARRTTRGPRVRRALLDDAARAAPRPRCVGAPPAWAWPEARLSYANAALPDALLAAGSTLGRPELVDRGLELLGWLLDRETLDGHLSVTPAGRRRAHGCRAGLRPAAHRGGGPGRRLRQGGRPARANPGGSTACGWPAPGSTAPTTPAP